MYCSYDAQFLLRGQQKLCTVTLRAILSHINRHNLSHHATFIYELWDFVSHHPRYFCIRWLQSQHQTHILKRGGLMAGSQLAIQYLWMAQSTCGK